MLFSSYIFLFFFLPVVLLGYYALGCVHWRMATKWLTLSSLVFYGWWNPESNEAWSPFFLILIVCSCAINFGCGNLLTIVKLHSTKKLLVTLGVAMNIGLLLYYKYTGLFAVWSQALSGWPTDIPHFVMPLAVSFFTFLQIAFLVDVYRGDKTGYSFWDYLLFVTFFPHLIAGPLVHHRELISQFRPEITRIKYKYIGIGLTLLILGLFKKVVLADNLATVVNPIFSFAAEGSRALTFGEAWAGGLAYTFQLYFDFSGYSDMAIGLSYLFGLRLPLNFNSPYKATSIVDFWRRWHMTLSRFLRRQPKGKDPPLHESHDHHAPGGAVAWCRSHLCALGRASRPLFVHQPRLGQLPKPDALVADAQILRYTADLFYDRPHLGAFSGGNL